MATRMTRLRWLLALVLLPAALYAFGEWRQWPWVRAPLERWLSGALQRDVAIADGFGVQTLGALSLRAGRFALGAPPDGPQVRRRPESSESAPLFLRAEQVRLVLPYTTLLALWRGSPEPPHVRSLDVDRLELSLVRDASGRANWRFGNDPQRSDADSRPPRFDRLVVQSARLWLDDAVNELSLVANLKTREGVALADSKPSGLEADAEGGFRGLPLEARLATSGVLPIAAGANAAPLPIALSLKVADNELELDGTVRDLLHLSALEARFRLAGSSLGAVGDPFGVALPTTPPFVAHGTVSKDGAVWRSAVAGFELGSSRLGGTFRYDPSQAPPLLAGELHGARLALADLGPAVTSVGPQERRAPAANARRQRGRVLPRQQFNLPALDRMQADVALDLKRFDLGTDRLAPIAPLRGRIVLHDSVLALEDLRAGSSGGELRGRLALDARPEVPRWHADVRWSGVELERFVTVPDRQAAAARAGAAAPGYVSGLLGGTARLAGSGRSTAQMLASLDGSMQMWVQNGAISELLVELMGIDVAESLGIVLSGDTRMPLRCAVARLAVDAGVVRPEVAVFDTPDSTLLVSGQVALGEERLDLTLQVKPKDVSLVALRGPLHVRGSFENPEVEFEKGAIGLRAAAAIALGAVVAPLAGVLALIDLGEGETAVCNDALENLRAPPPRTRRR